MIAGGLALAAIFMDLTWDGQWYHQTAVYEMAAGWNPLRDPMHDFGRHTWNLWVLHYAKGPWYMALAIYAATGSIEISKAASAIAPAMALLVVLAAALDFGLERRWAILVALVTALNPVTTCGIVTHQVDGILVSLMACTVAAGMCVLRRPRWLPALVVFVSSILCMNTKFTGLVYLCFFFLAGGLYCLWRRRDLILRYAGLVVATLVVGTVVLGFNPYVTNTVHRGHPFYPDAGFGRSIPSLADRGRDPIELYETPRNMMGRSRLLRLAYGVFGKPGTPPYVTKDAEFMWPFAVTWRDFGLYYFHDVRIGGFGPLFSGALLLALALAAVGMRETHRAPQPAAAPRRRHCRVAACQHPHLVGALRPAPLVAAHLPGCGSAPRRGSTLAAARGRRDRASPAGRRAARRRRPHALGMALDAGAARATLRPSAGRTADG